jgi:hypothetical protein
VADVEGGSLVVEHTGEGVSVSGDSAGLRDLARWCLAVSDEAAPPYSHIHLDPGTVPLTGSSSPILIFRAEPDDL